MRMFFGKARLAAWLGKLAVGTGAVLALQACEGSPPPANADVTTYADLEKGCSIALDRSAGLRSEILSTSLEAAPYCRCFAALGATAPRAVSEAAVNALRAFEGRSPEMADALYATWAQDYRSWQSDSAPTDEARTLSAMLSVRDDYQTSCTAAE